MQRSTGPKEIKLQTFEVFSTQILVRVWIGLVFLDLGLDLEEAVLKPGFFTIKLNALTSSPRRGMGFWEFTFGDFSFKATFFSAWSLKQFERVCPEALQWWQKWGFLASSLFLGVEVTIGLDLNSTDIGQGETRFNRVLGMKQRWKKKNKIWVAVNSTVNSYHEQ